MQRRSHRQDVRDINSRAQRGTHVIAAYSDHDVCAQGRIIRARQKDGQLQGFLLGAGVWVEVQQYWFVR